MKPSIRRRLLAILLSITTLVWLVTMVGSYRESQHEVEELFDAQLAQSARTLLAVAGHELKELDGVPDVTHIHFLPTSDDDDREEYEEKLAYQLWMQPQGRLILRSYMAPEAPLSTLDSGYSTEQFNGQAWRVFSLSDPQSGFQIKMGESLDIRDELNDEIVARMVVPMLLALPLLTLLIYIGIGRGLQPLQRLADTIRRREPGRLERVSAQDSPAEIGPLVNALNQLFERVEQSLENERRFTADAAHELRTPLAALKIQAQVAQRSSDTEERDHALRQLTGGIDRTTHLVEQLLTLSRIDPETAQRNFHPVSLRPIAEEVIAVLEPQATAKAIELQLQCEADAQIHGQGDGIAIALRNLVDNAIRYSPQGGTVAVTISVQENQVQIRVEDSGPGIPEGQREKIFSRFYRLAGQEVEGSGLGLSIVQRVVELHGAKIRMEESELGGLGVIITFKSP